MKKRFLTALIILLLCALALAKYMSELKSVTVYSMDTIMTVKATGSKKNLEYAENEIKRLDKIFNAYDKNSELYEINSFGSKKTSKEMTDILKKSVEFSEAANGNFDITLKILKDLWDINSENPKIPEETEIKQALLKTGMDNLEINGDNVVLKAGIQLDVGGIAKGYAADVLAEGLKKRGVKKFVLDLGGNIYGYSENKPLKIGIQNPKGVRGDSLCVLEITDAAVVSSGTYERNFESDGKVYHHILDPKTGYPADNGIDQVTIVGKNASLCDAFSTAIAVGGIDEAKKLYSLGYDFEYMVVCKNKLYISKKLMPFVFGISEEFEIVEQ